MRRIGILILCCMSLLSGRAGIQPNLYRSVDKVRMEQWVDSVFDALSFDERVGQLFMIVANPKSDSRNMQRLTRYVKRSEAAGIPL